MYLIIFKTETMKDISKGIRKKELNIKNIKITISYELYHILIN